MRRAVRVRFADIRGGSGSPITARTFLDSSQHGVPNDLARLCGARFVSAIELDQGRRLAEALVKQATGGDRITARFLFREFFEFMPAFKIWFAVNHKPRIRGTDHAIWRRIRLLPFTVTIPEAEQDRDLPAKLRDELPSILPQAATSLGRYRYRLVGNSI